MGVTVKTMAPAEDEPRGEGDPTAEDDQRGARRQIGYVSETFGGGDTGQPDEAGDNQSRGDVADACL